MNSTAAAAPIPDRTAARWFIWSFALSVFTMLLFPCACGHLHTDALLTSTLGAGAAWFPFFRYERTRVYDRCLAVFFVFISTLIFIKNVADVLWFGHEPLLR